jgi:hypothetical protein
MSRVKNFYDCDEHLELILQEETPENHYQYYMFQQAIDHCNEMRRREVLAVLSSNSVDHEVKMQGIHAQFIRYYALLQN